MSKAADYGAILSKQKNSEGFAYIYILGQFMSSVNKSDLRYGIHYFESLSEMATAYPCPAVAQKITHDDAVKLQASHGIGKLLQGKRKRKPSRRFRDSSSSTENGGRSFVYVPPTADAPGHLSECSYDGSSLQEQVINQPVPTDTRRKRKEAPSADAGEHLGERTYGESSIREQSISQPAPMDPRKSSKGFPAADEHLLHPLLEEERQPLEKEVSSKPSPTEKCDSVSCIGMEIGNSVHKCQRSQCNSFVHHLCVAPGCPENSYFCSTSCVQSKIDDIHAENILKKKDNVLKKKILKTKKAGRLDVAAKSRAVKKLASGAFNGVDEFDSKTVYFKPKEERQNGWLTHSCYNDVAKTSSYISGTLFVEKMPKSKSLGGKYYSVVWDDTQFVEKPLIDSNIALRGMLNASNQSLVSKLSSITSMELQKFNFSNDGCPLEEQLALNSDVEEDAMWTKTFDEKKRETNFTDIQNLKNLKFEYNAKMRKPEDLYKNPPKSQLPSYHPLHHVHDHLVDEDNDGNKTSAKYNSNTMEELANASYVKEKYAYLFKHSASSSFLSYLPLQFWSQVLDWTNEYKTMTNESGAEFELNEVFQMLGMLFAMVIVKLGNMEQYWKPMEPYNSIFGMEIPTFAKIMPWKRFQQLRRCLSFNSPIRKSKEANRFAPEHQGHDRLYKLRPLLNMLKVTCGKYINVGLNLSLDERTAAARSSFARDIICYNAKKPGGKFHFKIYALCCGDLWVCVSFSVHSHATTEQKMQALMSKNKLSELIIDLENVPKTPSIVLELCHNYFHTGRIVNTDNYYTSPKLLIQLALKGLKMRGTVRSNVKLYPNSVRFTAAELSNPVRGMCKVAVCKEHRMVACSWYDGNPVLMISNADSTDTSNVRRRINGKKRNIPSLFMIKHYNKYMQGVDRIDQSTAPFSLADHHSFKKWHKKLALSIIDLATTNAYESRRNVCQYDTDWPTNYAHRQFISDLSAELINGSWRNAPDQTTEMLYSPNKSAETSSALLSPDINNLRKRLFQPQTPGKSSKGMPRKQRNCRVCEWEGRKPSIVTVEIPQYKLCLCQIEHAAEDKPYFYSGLATCYEKFSSFYAPKGLWKPTDGKRNRMNTSCELYHLRKSEEDA